MKTRYVCQDCGSIYSKWSGKCENCQSWNRIVEEATPSKKALAKGTSSTSQGTEFVLLDGITTPPERFLSHIPEFDRVCGGGLVPGAALLVGGDPGVGKSTLLLQVVARLAAHRPCAYISGEEAVDQVRLRAQRLKANHPQIYLASSTHLEDILKALDQLPDLAMVVIDSIQTMASSELESAPGTVSQVRACAHELIQWGKQRGIVVVLVGHVTKEGALAGPRVLEHMVDSVLYFEGERTYQYRLLRAVKNRFGPTDEIGVFEMTEEGLKDVSNPSALFLAHRNAMVSGSAIFAGMEGTRPILCEIQALVASTPLAVPRRAAVGWDSGRLSMILAVLETRCKLSFANKDVYLNVAGGLKISEPAADLAVAAALMSALKNQPIEGHCVFYGEVGLGGEVRPVNQSLARIREAQKLGFTEAFMAPSPKGDVPPQDKISLAPVRFVGELMAHLGLSNKAQAA